MAGERNDPCLRSGRDREQITMEEESRVRPGVSVFSVEPTIPSPHTHAHCRQNLSNMWKTPKLPYTLYAHLQVSQTSLRLVIL